jgi:DNA-binding NarL/FixJ family response regulator
MRLPGRDEDLPRKHTIVIAEDHRILREGLRALLSSNPDFEIAGEVEDGLSAVQCVQKLNPDVVLMDLSMPRMHGMEAIGEIKRRVPGTKILVLTVHKAEEYILAAFEAGVHGYVLKDASHAELVTAIHTVLCGKPYLSPSVSEKVIAGYLEGKRNLKRESSWDSLTQREREILKLIAEGYKNKEIADLLCISAKTVEKHRANLMQKLGLHSASALTAFALERGLIGS